MSIGHFDVYDATYEDVVRKLAKAGYIPQGWTPGTPLPSTNGSGKTAMITSPSSSTYEFKWGNDATEIHGPYSAADMTAWKDSGYFDQEQKPWIRQTETGANFVEYNGSMTFIAF